MIHTVLAFLGLAAGLALLMKGADIFVDAGVGIARKLRLSPVLIGLTIISMGTSIPELVISTTAALRGANDLAVANAVGANIFNLLFILGLAAMVHPMLVRFGEVSREFWLSTGAAVFLLAITLSGTAQIPRFAAIMMLVVYVAYIVFLVRQAPRTAPNEKTTQAEAAGNERKLSTYIGIAILAAVLIFLGGQLTVWAAGEMGPILGLSERVVGLTIVSIATSLPELIIILIACKRGENEMAVGTIVGSNIFNIMVVLGVSGAIVPLAVSTGTLVDLAVLVGGCVLFFIFVTTQKRLARWEGTIMAAVYLGYMGWLLVG
ncbi:MAG: calcium/sodium antiporter [Defluviitaleaceae bacterium]|nr:calcium/sodium antiporter [Defluviitaleaceae bacterium]